MFIVHVFRQQGTKFLSLKNMSVCPPVNFSLKIFQLAHVELISCLVKCVIRGELFVLFPFQVCHMSTSCLPRHWLNLHCLVSMSHVHIISLCSHFFSTSLAKAGKSESLRHTQKPVIHNKMCTLFDYYSKDFFFMLQIWWTKNNSLTKNFAVKNPWKM